jgi:uncharacterized DUF497 family protein
MWKRPGLIATSDTLPADQDRLRTPIDAYTINSEMQFTFDPRKDASNIVKHGLSLSDAPLVFNAPNKLTIESASADEARLMDVALVELIGVVLVLVYVMRDPDEVRAISLRRGSKQERKLYAENRR